VSNIQKYVIKLLLINVAGVSLNFFKNSKNDQAMPAAQESIE